MASGCALLEVFCVSFLLIVFQNSRGFWNLEFFKVFCRRFLSILIAALSVCLYFLLQRLKTISQARRTCVNRRLNRSRLESRFESRFSRNWNTIATYLHTCLAGYVTCKHNLGPVNCVCLPCDSSPITDRVCTHNTQPSDRVNLFIYYHDLNTFQDLYQDSFLIFMQIFVPIPREARFEARFEARSI